MSAGSPATAAGRASVARGFAPVAVTLALPCLWVPGVSPTFVSPNELVAASRDDAARRRLETFPARVGYRLQAGAS